MIQTTAVVIGAGHAGLAMSRRLTERSIDHVVLERGEVANSWRTQRWPSLRLLTPNWQTRLPGHDYAGDDPDGFMPAADVVATLTAYARLVGAPVRTATDSARRAGRAAGLPDPGQRRPHRRPGRGAGDRGVHPAGDPGRRRRGTPVGHDAHPAGLPRSRPAPRRRGARGRRVSHRRPARRRDPPVRAPGDPCGRRTRPAAPHLPRPGHLLVAGGHGPAGRTLRPDRRPHPGPPPALPAAHRNPRSRYDRPQHAHGARGPHRRPPRPHHRRHSPVLRGTRQHLRPRRPEDEPVLEPGRPVGHRRQASTTTSRHRTASHPPASIPARPWNWT